MEKKSIRGTIKKIKIGTGFWGVIGHDRKEYRPVNLNPALKKEGLKISLTVIPVEEEVSVFMWGEPVKIV